MRIAFPRRLMTFKRTFYLVLWSGFCILLGVVLALYAESLLLFLILFAIVGFLVFMAMDFALYLMLICLPFSLRYILPSQMEVLSPTEPLLGMLVVTFFVKQILARTIKIGSPAQESDRFPLTLPILFYIAATFLPTFNSPEVVVSVKGAIRSAAYVMLSFLAYALIRNRQDLRRLFVSTFPSASVAVLWTSIVLVYHIDQWRWTSAYYGSPFTHYSVYGSFTAVFLFIAVSRLLLDRTPYDRVLWTILLIIFGVGMLLCFSRGVWMSMIITTGFLLMQIGVGEQHKKILLIGAILVFVLVVLRLPGISDLVLQQIGTVFNLQFASNKSRLLRWGQAFIMFLQHPIIGNGYGAFAMLYRENTSLVGVHTAQFQLGAHNEYLQVLAELGLVGFAAWLWIIIAFFRCGLRGLSQIADDFYRSLIIGLMTAELSMLVLFTVNSLPHGDELAVPFWLIYGLLPAVVNMANR